MAKSLLKGGDDAATYTGVNIKTLEALFGVRHALQMYIGATDTFEGLVNIAKEIVDNGNDEVLRNPNKLHHIDITIFYVDGRYQMLIKDTGRGVPIEVMDRAFTIPHTGAKFDRKAYSVSSGVWGVGSKAAAASSSKFIVSVKRPDGSGFLQIENCEITRFERDDRTDNNEDTTGTIIFFEPDRKEYREIGNFVMGEGYQRFQQLIEIMSITVKPVQYTIRMVPHLIDDEFFFGGKPYDNFVRLRKLEEGQIAYRSDLGIDPISYIRKKYDITSPTAWDIQNLQKTASSDDADRIAYDINIFLPIDSRKSYLLNAVNMVVMNDPEAYQVVGLMKALKRKLLPFISDPSITAFVKTTYRVPVSGTVLILYKGAKFLGQTKYSFQDADFLAEYVELLNHEFDLLSDSEWERFYELLETDIVKKYEAYTNRGYKTSKGIQNIPDEIMIHKCKSSDSSKIELFITEGNSAASGAKDARFAEFQAIYPIRGKSMNPERKSDKELEATKLYSEMIVVLNVRPTDKNLDGMNFKRIIIATDADRDGKHIINMVLLTMKAINPLLITEGRIAIAKPPLFSLRMRNSNAVHYAKNETDVYAIRVEALYSQMEITLRNHHTGKKAEISFDKTPEEFFAFCRMVTHLGNIFQKCATRLGIANLATLEVITSGVDYIQDTIDTEGLRKLFQVDKVIYDDIGNNLIFSYGDVEGIIPLNGLTREIRSYILPELKKLHYWDMDFMVTMRNNRNRYNKTPLMITEIFSIMNELDKLVIVDRFKGLGEMNWKGLRQEVMDPETRDLDIVTSVGDIQVITDMMGEDTQVRKQLIR